MTYGATDGRKVAWMTASKGPPPPPVGDAEIVRLLQDRDGSGLSRLVTDHGGRVLSGLRRHFGSNVGQSELDEMLATATIQVWRHADTYDPAKGSVAAWFLAIACNAGRQLFRSRKQRPEVLGIDLDGVVADGALVPMPSAALLALVHECIAQLPRLQRCVIEADLQNGDPVDAAALAAELNTTKNSIYVSRSAGRKALRHALLRRGLQL